MKTAVILFFLGISSAFAQVDCAKREQTFSGQCESYNNFTGVRSTYTYKKGELHGKFEEAYRNGQRRSEGAYKGGLLNGKFVSYYNSGEKMTTAKFKTGSGAFTMFHENGVRKVQGQFQQGQPSGKWSFYTSNGDLSREIESEELQMNIYAFLVGEESAHRKSVFDNFFESEGLNFSFGQDNDSTFTRMRKQMDESMKRMQAQMEQMMEGFSDSSFSRSFHFDTTITFDGLDNFFEFKSFGSDSSLFKSFHIDTIIGDFQNGSDNRFDSRKNDLVDFPDTEPSYVGGEEAMKTFVQTELQSSRFTEGKVFVEVIVEKDGSISNSRVVLGTESEGQNAEALKVVRAMSSWNPATFEGQSVRSRCVIPIEF